MSWLDKLQDFFDSAQKQLNAALKPPKSNPEGGGISWKLPPSPWDDE